MGEVFYLKVLARDCATDHVYDSFLRASAAHHAGRWDRRKSIAIK